MDMGKRKLLDDRAARGHENPPTSSLYRRTHHPWKPLLGRILLLELLAGWTGEPTRAPRTETVTCMPSDPGG